MIPSWAIQPFRTFSSVSLSPTTLPLAFAAINPSTGKTTPNTTNSGPVAIPTDHSPSPMSARANTLSTPSPTTSSANTPKPTSPSSLVKTSTSASSTGNPSATADNSGTSASPTAPPPN